MQHLADGLGLPPQQTALAPESLGEAHCLFIVERWVRQRELFPLQRQAGTCGNNDTCLRPGEHEGSCFGEELGCSGLARLVQAVEDQTYPALRGIAKAVHSSAHRIEQGVGD